MMTPAEIALDPWWTPKPFPRNPLFRQLVAEHGLSETSRLWEQAAAWHAAELASELRYRTLGDVA